MCCGNDEDFYKASERHRNVFIIKMHIIGTENKLSCKFSRVFNKHAFMKIENFDFDRIFVLKIESKSKKVL